MKVAVVGVGYVGLVAAIMHVREIVEHDMALVEHIGESPESIHQQLKSLTDFFIANSHTTSKYLSTLSKTFVVENCVDIEQFKGLPKRLSESIYVALISSNIPKKGIHDFVEISQKLSIVSGETLC